VALLLLDVEVALAIKDDLADDAVVVTVIPELIALGIDICARLLLANRRAGVMIVANNMVGSCRVMLPVVDWRVGLCKY